MSFKPLHKYLIVGLIILTNTLNSISQSNKYKEYITIKNEVSKSYPEFDSSQINLKFRKICSTMAVRPAVGNIFRSKPKYNIFINTSPKHTGFTIDSLSKSMVTSIFGHEMAHIATYSKLNSFQTMIFGMKYLTPRFKQKVERSTDSIAISKGFGKGLLEFTHYVYTSKSVNPEYKLKKEKYYLTEEEIFNLLKIQKIK
jgi:hypothetical protein